SRAWPSMISRPPAGEACCRRPGATASRADRFTMRTSRRWPAAPARRWLSPITGGTSSRRCATACEWKRPPNSPPRSKTAVPDQHIERGGSIECVEQVESALSATEQYSQNACIEAHHAVSFLLDDNL